MFPTGSLGDPRWGVRETAEKNHNFFSALLLTDGHPDPEVRERIFRIKRRHLFDPKLVEQRIRRDNPALWFERYLVNGDSHCWSKKEIFVWLRSDSFYHGAHMKNLFCVMYPPPNDYYGHLVGQIARGEWEKFLYHLKQYDEREKGHAAVFGVIHFAVP